MMRERVNAETRRSKDGDKDGREVPCLILGSPGLGARNRKRDVFKGVLFSVARRVKVLYFIFESITTRRRLW